MEKARHLIFARNKNCLPQKYLLIRRLQIASLFIARKMRVCLPTFHPCDFEAIPLGSRRFAIRTMRQSGNQHPPFKGSIPPKFWLGRLPNPSVVLDEAGKTFDSIVKRSSLKRKPVRSDQALPSQSFLSSIGRSRHFRYFSESFPLLYSWQLGPPRPTQHPIENV